MIVRALVAGLLALHALVVSAADPCPPTKTALEWSTQCFEGEGKSRRVKPGFMNRITTNRYGMTTILIGAPRELVAVDRRGKIVIPDIQHTGDFDFPNAHLGIGRFSVIEKDALGKPAEQCGYFQAERFRIIVPARFDHCQPFREQQAMACNACASYCTEFDCQNRILVGGQGVVLGSDGHIRRTIALPTVETVCDRPELARISELSNGATLLRCENGPGNPFNEM
jgi:hypothetical protein